MTSEERVRLVCALTKAKVAYYEALEAAGYEVGVRAKDGSQAILDSTKSLSEHECIGSQCVVGYITLKHEIKI